MDLRAQKDECLILRGRDFNESDRLLTVFGRRLGKLACLAKGVRKPQSRLKAATLPYACSQLEFAAASPRSSSGLRLVTQGETLYSFSELREELVRIGLANYVTELLDWVLPPDKPQENLYVLAVTTLLLLAAVEEPRQQYLLLKFFELRLLGELGWRPQLEKCARCGRRLTGFAPRQLFAPAPALGGMVCASCRRDLAWSVGGEPAGRGISLGGIKILSCLQNWEPRRFLQLHYQTELRRELNQTLWAYLDHHLGRGSQKARQNLLLYCNDIIM